MALAIAGAAAVAKLSIKFQDVKGDTVSKHSLLGGSMDDTDILALCTAIDAVTNAGVLVASYNGRAITGWASANNALQSVVSMLMVLNFSQPDPINSGLTISRNFVIPAYLDAADVSGKPDYGSNTHIQTIINSLIVNLAFKDHAGTYHTGSPTAWTYNVSRSGFGTSEAEING